MVKGKKTWKREKKDTFNFSSTLKENQLFKMNDKIRIGRNLKCEGDRIKKNERKWKNKKQFLRPRCIIAIKNWLFGTKKE